MAKHRTVNTHFWDDSYIETLSPNEILLFLFLITNPQTNIAGSYEITITRMYERTRLSKTKIAEILKKFEADGKFIYKDNWMLAVNAISHQKTDVPTILKGIETIILDSPRWVIDRVLIDYQGLWIDPELLILFNSIVFNGNASQIDPPPKDDLGMDVLILQTESVLKIKLDLEEKRTVVEAIPISFTNDWTVFLKSRALKLGKNPNRAGVIQALSYALTDYRKDRKKEYEQLNKPEQQIPSTAEVEREREEHRYEPRTNPDGTPFVLQRVPSSGFDN